MFNSKQHPAAAGADGFALPSATWFSLRGIRFVEGPGGGAPAGDDGAQPPQEPQEPHGGQQQATPPAPKPTPPPQQPHHEPQQSKTYPQEYVTDLREEAKGYRTELASTKQTLDATTQERDAARAELDRARRENAVVRNAADVGGNADLLLDSGKFADVFEQVNLSDGEAVKAAIKEFVEKNPAYSATPRVPGSSGASEHGGDQPSKSPLSLQAAVAAAMGGK